MSGIEIITAGDRRRRLMLEALKTPFGGCRALQPVEVLSDNGSPYVAREAGIFARRSA